MCRSTAYQISRNGVGFEFDMRIYHCGTENLKINSAVEVVGVPPAVIIHNQHKITILAFKRVIEAGRRSNFSTTDVYDDSGNQIFAFFP